MPNTKINIIDSMMGSGKSTFIINHINNNPDKDYVIVLETRQEVERFKDRINRQVFAPHIDNIDFRLIDGFQEAIKAGQTIVTTHTMLSNWDSYTTNLIRKGNYTLVLDEVVDVVLPVAITNDDFNMLLKQDYIFIIEEDDNMEKVIANVYKPYSGRLSGFYNTCNNNSVYRVNDSFCVSLAPPEKLSAFKQVYILTYLFKDSEMANWLKLFNMNYSLHSVRNGVLIEHTLGNPEQFKHLITIVSDKGKNDIGKTYNSCSFSWYDKAKPATLKRLKGNAYNFFRSVTKSKPDDNAVAVPNRHEKAITCYPFKTVNQNSIPDFDVLPELEKTDRLKCTLAFNARGTNNFRHKKYLAYLVNVYLHPSVDKFFSSVDLMVDKNTYALSTLIQCIWRTQIRNGKPITLYIPSKRMRQILFAWLSGRDVSLMSRKALNEMDKELHSFNKEKTSLTQAA